MMSTRRKVAVTLAIVFALFVILLSYSGLFNVVKAKKQGYFLMRPTDSHDRKQTDFAFLKVSRHAKNELSNGSTLPTDVIDHIEKFVFFVGYPRSGHSIVGSLMDSHPHMVIANEFMLFRNWKYYSERQKATDEDNPFLNDQEKLFNAIYRRSNYDVEKGFRSETNTKKNYTLHVNHSWQGKFDRYITVIGDKSGSSTCDNYLSSSEAFTRYLEELQTTLTVPIRVIHVVRNPFDQISTCVLYKDYRELSEYTGIALKQDSHKHKKYPTKHASTSVSRYKAAMTALQTSGDKETFAAAMYDSEKRLTYCIEKLVRRSSAATAVMDLVGLNTVLNVHNRDLVHDPKTTMAQLCNFLEVYCDQQYIQASADKVFKSISKTRDMLMWSSQMKQLVEEEVIQKYPFFSRYSFDSD